MSGASDRRLPGGYTNYLDAWLADPELNATLDDSELMAMLHDICKNPCKNLPKYATHPKILILNEMIERKKAAGIWPTTPDSGVPQIAGAEKKKNRRRRCKGKKKNERELQKNENPSFSKKAESTSSKKPKSVGKTECEQNDKKYAALSQYYNACLTDPELYKAWNDPEIAAMYNDIGRRPLNVLKYINNPKYIAYEELLARKKAAGILPKSMSREMRKEFLACVGDDDFHDAIQEMYNNPQDTEKWYGNPKVRKFFKVISKDVSTRRDDAN